MTDSVTRNMGCGERTQAFLDSIPHYAVQANTHRSLPPVPGGDRKPAASLPPEAAGEPIDLLAIPDFLRRKKA